MPLTLEELDVAIKATEEFPSRSLVGWWRLEGLDSPEFAVARLRGDINDERPDIGPGMLSQTHRLFARGVVEEIDADIDAADLFNADEQDGYTSLPRTRVLELLKALREKRGGVSKCRLTVG